MNSSAALRSSFRDPSGFLFEREGVLYRQVNQRYSEHYLRMMRSGLYETLVGKGLLVPHAEVGVPAMNPETAFKVIQPDRIPFVSYPYEWSFSMKKDAALATLSIEREALAAGLTLKDASAYNIQFVDGKPLLIDTLSFEAYCEGEPWVAYRQFCQHFLAPLALMANVDVRLGQMARLYIDGVPLDLAAQLLPWQSRLDPSLLIHIHLHARLQRSYADRPVEGKLSTQRVSKAALLSLIEGLEGAVKKLRWKPAGTEWGDYYRNTNYTDAAFQQKADLVSEWVAQVKPQIVWDLGANDGTFSRLASERGIPTLAFDIDPAAVEQNYLKVKQNHERNLVPLILDLTNPSPAIGWHNRERESIMDRAPADMVFALALVHHLAISNNVPFRALADFFADTGRWLIIEFVPKTDSQVQRLLRSRKDIFDHYDIDAFERAFRTRFLVRQKASLVDSERCLYLMERN